MKAEGRKQRFQHPGKQAIRGFAAEEAGEPPLK